MSALPRGVSNAANAKRGIETPHQPRLGALEKSLLIMLAAVALAVLPISWITVEAGSESRSKVNSIVATGSLNERSQSTHESQAPWDLMSYIESGIMFRGAPVVLVPDGPTTFTNSGAMSFPPEPQPPTNPYPASLYPSNIVVSGMTGPITKVTVTLHNISDTFPDDIDVLLVAPSGEKLTIMSDAGGSPDVNNVTLTFDDGAASALPENTQIVSGTFKPTDYDTVEDCVSGQTCFPAPAPTPNPSFNPPYPEPAPAGTSTLASVFNGISANGTWKLYAVDDASGDTGSIAGGWSIEITTAALAVATTTSIVSSQNPSLRNQAVTFTASVKKTSDNSNVTEGTVTFKDGGAGGPNLTCVGGNPVNLNGSGQAACTVAANGFSEGDHTIAAVFNGTASFSTSNSSLSQRVDNPTTVTGNEFCNTGNIAVSDSPVNANPYPSHIFVSGLGGSITKVTLELNNVTHGSGADLDMLLVGPQGQKFVVMSDAGGNTADITNATIMLDDAAGSLLPSSGSVVSGTFKPTNHVGGADTFPSTPAGTVNDPAPTASATFASVFNGTDPNGTWSLYVTDDSVGDTGSIAGGWCLNFTTSATDAPTTTTLNSAPNPSLTTQAVTFTATVTSSSTVNAGSVTFREGLANLTCTEGAQPRPVSSGTALCTVAAGGLSAGAHIMSADYGGSLGQFNTSTGTTTHFVGRATTVNGTTFCDPNSISIPDSGKANPYPSLVFVSGLSGTIDKVTVDLKNLSHTNPDDIDVMLVGPGGQNIVLMSDAGGTSDISGVNLTFDDTAGSTLPDTTLIASGTYKPSNYLPAEAFPVPAPAPSANTTFSGIFNGGSPNGTWALYVHDDNGNDLGQIAGGWCFNLTIIDPAAGNDDSYTTNEDTPLSVVAPGVLVNDTGSPAPTVLPASGATAQGGTYTISANGSFTYTPPANFNSAPDDSFTYTATNASGSDTGTVTITVNSVNDAPTLNALGNATIAEDAGLQTVNLSGIGAGSGEVQTLTVTAVSNNTGIIPNPTVTYTSPNSTGSLSYTPVANANGGPVTITVTVMDSGGTVNGGVNSFQRTFTVTLTEVNDAPIATDDTPADILEDSGANNFAIATLMGNDNKGAANESSQTLNITGLSNPTGGTVQIVAANVVFTPTANYSGPARFDYTVTDNGTTNGALDAKSDTGTVTFNVTAVNDVPTLDALSNATIAEDAGLQTVNLSGIGAGSGETQTLTVTAVSNNTGIIPNPTVTYTSPNSTGSLSYTPVADANGGPVTITVTVMDNGGTTNGGVDSFQRTFTVNISAVNDAPTFQIPTNPPAVNEDAPAQTANGFATNFQPGPVTATDEGGQTLVGYTVTANGTTGNLTFTSGPSINNAGQLSYTPTANTSGTATFNVVATDSGSGAAPNVNQSAPVPFTITVNGQNDAPVLDNSGNMSLTGIAEDVPAASNPGTLVGDIIASAGGDRITDVDAGAVEGMAVTAVVNTNGTWQFSIDNGTNWTPFGAPDALNSRLLAANANTRIRFLPNLNFNGTVDPGITFRAWDQTSGANGGTADTSVNGNTTAFSTATETASIAATAVNDNPTTSGLAPVIVNEDAPDTVINLAASFNDVEDGPSGVTYSVTGNTNPALFSAVTVNNTADTLTLDYAPNASGASQITVRATDSGGLFIESTFTVTVNAINDPPSFTKGADQTVNEDAGAQTVIGWATNISQGPGESGQTLTFNVTVGGTTGNLAFSSAPTIDATTGALTYSTSANTNGTATINVRLSDNGSNVAPNSNTSAVQQFTITVNAVNDAPTFQIPSNPPAVNEDAGAQTVNGFATNFQPGPATATDEVGQTLVGYTVTQTGATGGLTFSSAPSINNAGQLSYTPSANSSGTATFDVVATDSGSGAAPNVNQSAPVSFTITVNGQNDAPVLDNTGNLTLNAINEDVAAAANAGTLVSDIIGSAGGDRITDVDAGAIEGLAVTAVDNTNGTWQFSIDNGTIWTAFGSPNATTARLLAADALTRVRFLPNLNFNGTIDPGITFRAWDQTSGTNGSTADPSVDNGGIFAFSTATETSSITVNAVNDNPTIIGIPPVNVNEDAADTVIDLRLYYNDVEDGPAGLVYTITGNTNPALFTSTSINNANDNLTLDYAPNASGVAQLTIRGTDSGGLFVDTILNVTVNAINDPPSFTKGANQTVTEDAGAQTVVGWATNISQGPGESGQTLTFNVSVNGTTGNLAFSSAPVINSSTGTLAYTPAANTNGTATINVTLSDNGSNTPPNSNTSAVQQFTITVNAVNDAPTFQIVSNPPAVNEDAGAQAVNSFATNFQPGPASASDETGQTLVGYTVTQTGTTGGLTFSIAPSINNAGQLTYTPSTNTSGTAAFNVVATDSGSGTAPNVNQSAPVSFTITVNGQNDAPVLDNSGDMALNAINEDVPNASNQGTLISDIILSAGADRITDVDSGAVEGIAVTGVDNANGTWQFAIDGGTNWTPFGTPDALNARLLAVDVNTRVRFVPGLNFNGTIDPGLTFRAWDQTSGANGNTADTSITGGTAAFSVATETASITVNPVNDNPTTSSIGAVNVNEDAVDTIINLAASFNDVEDGSGGVTYTLQGNTNPALFISALVNNATDRLTLDYAPNANGVSQITIRATDSGGLFVEAAFTVTVSAINDAPTADSQSTSTNEDVVKAITLTGSDVETAAGSLTFTITALPTHGILSGTGPNRTYTPDADYNGPDSFKFTVTDTGDGASPAIVSTEASVSITVNAVNDAPTASAQSISTNEDVAKAITLTGSDVETAVGSLTSTITVLPTHGTLSGTGANRTYAPNTNYNGPDSFKFTVTDTGDGASPALVSTEAAVSITVNSVNDVPSFTKGPDQTVNDPNPQTVSNWATNISAGPPDESPQTFSFLVTNDSNAFFQSQPAIDSSGTLTYRAAFGAEGVAMVSVRLKDSGGTANGGVDTSATQTFTITVHALNNAPTLDPLGNLTINEDASLQTVNLAGITPGPSFESSQTLTIAATSGNPALIPNPTVAYTNPNNTGSISFSPVPNANGSVLITVTVKDSGGTAGGGIDTFSRTFTVTVSPINDAPVNQVPGNQNAALNGTLIFSTANSNLITISDVDAGSDPVQVTLKATDGTLTLGTTSGLLFTAGDGTGDPLMTFTGSIVNINAALNGMSNLAFGSGVIEITTNDLGRNGAGGPLSDTDTIQVTVIDNLAPVLLTIPGSDRAIAFDSVTFVIDPFSLQGNNNFSADYRTRIALFALHAQLRPGETASAITAEADVAGTIVPLTVEFVGTVPNFDWLTQIVVKLPDHFSTGGGGPHDAKIRIRLRGQNSNQAVITVVPAP